MEAAKEDLKLWSVLELFKMPKIGAVTVGSSRIWGCILLQAALQVPDPCWQVAQAGVQSEQALHLCLGSMQLHLELCNPRLDWQQHSGIQIPAGKVREHSAALYTAGYMRAQDVREM